MQSDKNPNLLSINIQISRTKFQDGNRKCLDFGFWILEFGIFFKSSNLLHLCYNFSFILFILIQSNNLHAQNLQMRHYTRDDGLPSSTLYQLTQDQDGFIWFGTNTGVTRFDGKNFQNFTITDGLSDNDILAVRTDSKGRIWFLGFNGTVSYWLKGKIYNAESDTILRHITASNSFVDLFEDNTNRLWFTSLYGYIILDKNKIIKIDPPLGATPSGIVINGKSGPIILKPYPPFFRQFVSGTLHFLNLQYKIKMRSGFLRYQDGSVLFISNEGVVWQKDTIQKLILPFLGDYANSMLVSMALSADSLLWITVLGKGLYCYDLKNTKAPPEILFKNEICNGVLVDRDGNIWVSTRSDGLYMIPVWGKKITLLNKGNGLPENPSFAICELNTGQLLIAQDQGKLILISKTGYSEIQTPSCENEFNMVYRILSLNDDVWIASDCGLLHLNEKTGCKHFVNCRNSNLLKGDYSSNFNVKDITLGSNKVFIAGSIISEYLTNCPVNYDYMTSKLTEKTIRTYSIYCDRSYRLWYGTINGLKSIKDGAFFDHSSEDVLLAKRINCIVETSDSVLVLVTHGYGVLFYKNGKIVRRVTTKEGLCNDICRKVFVHKDRIYVCTPSGVSVLDYSKGKVYWVQNMNEGNCLPSDDVFDIFVDDEDISVATMNGVTIISQKEFEKIKPIVPLLYIFEIRINDKMISLENEFTFSYRKNSLKINFIGINYLQPNEVNYRYRLKEDQVWNATDNTTLEFSFLSPGEYNFQIQARVQNGDWSPVRSFSFTITPPFWNTNWFRLLGILVLIFSGYSIARHQLKMSKRKKDKRIKIEKQIAELEQQALQTMMSPHFIFNVMNSIQQFINVNDKKAANHYLTDFASLIRMNLSISYKRFIPLDKEIDYLNLYLKFEKLRYGDKLTYDINVNSEIDCNETTIPVMMIQPFIENAIWHGITPIISQGYVRVQIDKEADELIKIRVEDNGVGIDQKFISDDFNTQTKESHALNMTVQRIHLLEKSSGHKLYISYKHLHPEIENKGTVAEMILPAVFY